MSRPYGPLKFLPGPADGTTMTMPVPPSPADKPKKAGGKPSIEHIVLGAVLVVVLGVGGWFLLKPGSSAKTAASTPAAIPSAHSPQSSGTAATTQVVPQLKPTKIALTPMTKAAYLKAGNKICTRMNAATKALGDFPSDPKAASAFVSKTFAITEKARKLLVALPPPTALKAELTGYYKDVAKLDATGKSLAKLLLTGNATQVKALEQKLGTLADKANAESISYGLTVCGQP